MNSGHSDAVIIVRPNKPRRYKLLSQNRLKIPSGLVKKYEYTKHMPLIQVDSDEDVSEDIDCRAFRKVSNRNLRELLHQDRTKLMKTNTRTTNGPDANEDDDWDLSLTLPHSSPTHRCGCLPVPECTIS